MQSRQKLSLIIVALVLVIELIIPARAQNSESYRATLVVRVDQPRWTINRNIYGQFAEHLGRLVYEGLWVGENSPIPNTRALRNDALAALKELHIPVLTSWTSTIHRSALD